MPDTKLAVKYRAIGDLAPYARNSRTHSEKQVEQIAASIKEFGFTQQATLEGDGRTFDEITAVRAQEAA
jgi:ParB-like chromosome segregation protein Spo0J